MSCLKSCLAIAVLLCFVTSGRGITAPRWPLNFMMQYVVEEMTNQTTSLPTTVFHAYDSVTYVAISGSNVHYIRCAVVEYDKIDQGIDAQSDGTSCVTTMLSHSNCIIREDYLLNGIVSAFFQGNLTEVKWTLVNSTENSNRWLAIQTAASVVYEETADTSRQPISLSLILEDNVIGVIKFLVFKSFDKGGDMPIPAMPPSCANNTTNQQTAKQPMIDAKCDACRFAANQLANQAVKAMTGSTCYSVAGRVLGWCTAVTGVSNILDLGATELGCFGASIATWVACSSAQSHTLGKGIVDSMCVPMGYCCPTCKNGASCDTKTHTCECLDGYYGNECKDPLPGYNGRLCPQDWKCTLTSCSAMVPIAALSIGEPRGTIVLRICASCGIPKEHCGGGWPLTPNFCQPKGSIQW